MDDAAILRAPLSEKVSILRSLLGTHARLSYLPRWWHSVEQDAFLEECAFQLEKQTDEGQVAAANQFTLLQFNLLAEGLCSGEGGTRELAYPESHIISHGLSEKYSVAKPNAANGGTITIAKTDRVNASKANPTTTTGAHLQLSPGLRRSPRGEVVRKSFAHSGGECPTPFRHSNS